MASCPLSVNKPPGLPWRQFTETRHNFVYFLFVIGTMYVVGASNATQNLNGTCQSLTYMQTSLDMINLVRSDPYSVGYTAYDNRIVQEAQSGDIIIAQLIGSAGNPVSVSIDTVEAAVRAKAFALSDPNAEGNCSPMGLCANILSPDATDAWPISTMTYIMVPTNWTGSNDVCMKAKALHDYIHWILTSDRVAAVAHENHFGMLPTDLKEKAKQRLEYMKCNGIPVQNITYQTGLQKILLYGTGSSLAKGLYDVLNLEYAMYQNEVIVQYDGGGSGVGIQDILQCQIDFAGTDALIDYSKLTLCARQQNIQILPMFASAVIIFAHLSLGSGAFLRLNGPIINDIFLGKITCWNDSRVQQLNPSLNLPTKPILRVVRDGTSGTTQTMTNAMAIFAKQTCAEHVLHCLDNPDWPPSSIDPNNLQGPCPCQDVVPPPPDWELKNVFIGGGVAALVTFLLIWIIRRWIRQRDASLWSVSWAEISFYDYPRILGMGCHGIVSKVIFRGGIVACKRLMPSSRIMKLKAQGCISADYSAWEDHGRQGGNQTSIVVSWLQNTFGRSSSEAFRPPSDRVTDCDLNKLAGDGTVEPKVFRRLGSKEEAFFSGNFSGSKSSQGEASRRYELLIGRGQGISLSARSRIMAEVRVMISMRHPNLCPIMGACLDRGRELIIMQYFEYGSVRDMADNQFDFPFDVRMEIATGIACGMQYVHLAKPPVLHRNLKAANVLLDLKLTPKVSDFGLKALAPRDYSADGALPFWWTAPELLDGGMESTASDVYAYAITLWELFHPRTSSIYPNAELLQTLELIKRGELRPMIDESVPSEIIELMHQCWSSAAESRPGFSAIVNELTRLSRDVDFMRRGISSTSHSSQIIVPSQLLHKVQMGRHVPPERYESASIMFFSIHREESEDDPSSLRQQFEMKTKHLINSVADKHSALVMPTCNPTCYMFATGIPEAHPDHAFLLLRLAMNLVKELIVLRNEMGCCLSFRAGVHAGEVVSFVVNCQTPKYCAVGSAVSVASELEKKSGNNSMLISQRTFDLLHSSSNLQAKQIVAMFAAGGNIDLKFGLLPSFVLARPPEDLACTSLDNEVENERPSSEEGGEAPTGPCSSVLSASDSAAIREETERKEAAGTGQEELISPAVETSERPEGILFAPPLHSLPQPYASSPAAAALPPLAPPLSAPLAPPLSAPAPPLAPSAVAPPSSTAPRPMSSVLVGFADRGPLIAPSATAQAWRGGGSEEPAGFMHLPPWKLATSPSSSENSRREGRETRNLLPGPMTSTVPLRNVFIPTLYRSAKKSETSPG